MIQSPGRRLPLVTSLPDVCCCRFRLPDRAPSDLPPEALAVIGRLGAELLTELLVRGALAARLPQAKLFGDVAVLPAGPWPGEVDPRQERPAAA